MNVEERRFDLDSVVHTLAFGAQRRHVVSVLAGSLLGLGTLPAMARKKRKKKRKKKNRKGQNPGPNGCAAGTKSCQGTCIPASQCCGDADCNRCAQEVCQAGACVCPTSMTRDSKGFCGVRPTCVPAGRISTSEAECCSGSGTPGAPGTFTCKTGKGPCFGDSGCVGNGPCLGYMCPALYVETVGATCKQVQTCASKDDCDSRLCQDGICLQCGQDSPCSGAGELCVEGWCYGFELAPSCEQCPPNTEICTLDPGGTLWGCLRRSGT
jgi:hypothetical protein